MLLKVLVNEATIGRTRMIIDTATEVENRLITFIWSCTNFLVPKTNGLLLSFKS